MHSNRPEEEIQENIQDEIDILPLLSVMQMNTGKIERHLMFLEGLFVVGLIFVLLFMCKSARYYL